MNQVLTPTLEQALATLIQQGQQTNTTLGRLAEEMAVMNRQLFEQRSAANIQAFTQANQGYLNGGRPGPATITPPAAPSTAPDGWQKTVEKARCARISISKTRNLNWKLVFHLDGIVKPAMLKSKDGYRTLYYFIQEVWQTVSEDHFSEERYGELDKQYQIERQKNGSNQWHYQDSYNLSPFIVEFYDTAPRRIEQPNGKVDILTFRLVERVYPCPPVVTAQSVYQQQAF